MRNIKFVKPIMGIYCLIFLSCSLYAQGNLFKAIQKGNVEAVEKYIAKRGDLNVTKEMWSYDAYYDKDTSNLFSPMEFAALGEQVEILKIFIENKEKIQDYPKHLNKAFATSIASGNMELIHLLIEEGADINTICSTCYGQAAIQIALEYSYFDLVEELMNLGAELNVSSNMGRTLLHAVAHTDNIALAEKLLDSGLNVNAQDEDGATPIHFAASNGYFEMLKLFEKHGASFQIIENDGRDLMMNAALGGSPKLISYLIDKGIDVNTYDNENWTPLLFACSENHHEAAEILIKASAEIDIMNIEGETALIWAMWNGNPYLSKTIIEAGADLQSNYDYRKYAKKNIKDKEFLKYLENKYEVLNSEIME